MEEYYVARKYTNDIGVEDALKPTPPSGDGWTLVSVAMWGAMVIFWWKREKRKELQG
jgi:hypothetical protein